MQVTTYTRVRRLLSNHSHKTTQGLRKQSGKGASTAQGSMSLYMSEREQDSVPAGHPCHASNFFACLCWEKSDQNLDFSGRAVLRFMWQHNTEVTGKNENASLELPKKAVPSHTQGIAPHF